MPASPRLSRRTTLVGAFGGTIAALALTGCDADDLKPHDAEPGASTSATPHQPTADEALVSTVVAQVQVALVAADQARRVHALRAPLGPLVKTHRAHLALLDPRTKPSAAPSKPVPKPLEALVAAETALQQQLSNTAVQAESGALARALASMSASIAQHLASAPLTARAAA